MCGISGMELLIILVIAIIVMGPDKLPEVLRAAGKMTREVRKVAGDLSRASEELKQTLPTTQIREQARQLLTGAELDAPPAPRTRTRDASTESEIDAIRARKKARAAEVPVVTPLLDRVPAAAGAATAALAGAAGAPGVEGAASPAGVTEDRGALPTGATTASADVGADASREATSTADERRGES